MAKAFKPKPPALDDAGLADTGQGWRLRRKW
jgi:hypothetical protein